MSVRHKVDLERMLHDGSAEPMQLSLSLLEDITNGFSDDQQIGRGGSAVVYKGMVGIGVVAVKKLSNTFGVHENKFSKEVECLMKAKHKYIVRFLGYCSDTQGTAENYEGKFVMAEERSWLLCFEYVPNGSLDKYITDASHGLEWWERYKIIKGICEGLLHLHEKRILHLDMKPGNILVDNHMVPKIADFGLSRCLDKEQTRASTLNPCGSMGYLAPESFGGKFAFASDIYSLGVIIVEIMTGEKAYPEDEDVVKAWRNRLEGSDQLNAHLKQVRVCINIGMECIGSDPRKRPAAGDINDRLDKISSTIESGISSSSVEQEVSFLKEQNCQEKVVKQNVGTPKEDHWQQEASDDQCSLWASQDTKQNVSPQVASISSSNSGVFYKMKNSDIFGRKARRNYVRYGGPILEKDIFVVLFKWRELKPFINRQKLIGKGSFGEVYLGSLDKLPITVWKLINATVRDIDQFAKEAIILSRVIHKNVLRLIGCCVEVDSPMLVYEYFSKVSLHEVLHSNNRAPLNLSARLNIALESANGLAYIHSEAITKILHGEVRPTNILLDANFSPKIADFGLSRLFMRKYEHSGPTIGGMAYTDPVFLRTGLLTEKTDVYSFGVVMLELLTRKKATHANNNSLVMDFLENQKQGRKSTELFDKEIADTSDLELLENLAEIAVECLNLDADKRPTMTDVAWRILALHRSHGEVVS